MILVLDIGNSNIKCAAFAGMDPIHGWRISTDRFSTHDQYGIATVNFLHHFGYKVEDIEGVIFSSVVPYVNYTIEQMCENYLWQTPMQVLPGMKTGINIRYENPRELGADRICNAVAAHEYYDGPLITIDFGTATTFGAITARGDFIGGAICPGLRVSSDVLTERAAQLSKVELVRPERVIARNTVQNVQSGIIYGHVGLVDYIVRKMKLEMNEPKARVIATGGMGRIIEREAGCIDIFDANLTLKGLRLLYERNRGAEKIKSMA